MRPVLATLAGFAFLAALLAWGRWLGGRRGAALGHLLLAAALAAVTVLGWPLSRYLDGYDLRRHESPVAEVFFERVGPGRFRVAVTRLPGGRMQVVDLAGDQWRIELQVLDWADAAAHLGAVARYRIVGLTSRPAAEQAPGLPIGTAVVLDERRPTAPGIAALSAGGGRPLLAARALSSPWAPMADGARVEVRLTADDRIEVGPLNGAAEDNLAAR